MDPSGQTDPKFLDWVTPIASYEATVPASCFSSQFAYQTTGPSTDPSGREYDFRSGWDVLYAAPDFDFKSGFELIYLAYILISRSYDG